MLSFLRQSVHPPVSKLPTDHPIQQPSIFLTKFSHRWDHREYLKNMFLFKIMPWLPWILSSTVTLEHQTKVPLNNFLEKLTKRQQLRYDTLKPLGFHPGHAMHQKEHFEKQLLGNKQLSPSQCRGERVFSFQNYVNCVNLAFTEHFIIRNATELILKNWRIKNEIQLFLENKYSIDFSSSNFV